MSGDPSPRRYADPYLAGVSLGLVLLASFVITGRGLGASGALTGVAAGVTAAVARDRAEASALFAPHLAGVGPWRAWISYELIGVAIGGCLSAWRAGRWRREIERGSRISREARLACALFGGAAMGLGAVLARGCTSGLALTGGALLGVGSWVFMIAAFAAAYAIAPIARRWWR